MSVRRITLLAVCALVIGIYAYMAQSPIYEPWRSWGADAARAQYNQLVQGFRIGHLSMNIDVPPGLTELPDPYDPTANDLYRETPYKFHDLSYYKGKLYLYFGVAPALLLFWPFAALTGHYLLHRDAVLFCCSTGFLASVGILRALWRRYFAEVSVGVVAACAVALGLASGMPTLLSRAGLQEVPISCGYMLTMLTLVAMWRGLHESERRCWWLAAASLAYGLAVASRPNLVFGGIILLVPVVQAWRERRKVWVPLLAAIGPIVLVGLGLMVYNFLRFDNPFEIGVHYALTGENLVSRRPFGFQYLWFHFRVYFLEPARWSGRFPFVHNITMPPLPAGAYGLEPPFGVLANIPVVWMALAAPLAWRTLPRQDDSGLRWFTGAVALLFWVCAVTLCLVFATAFRYEVDFLPTLMVLAVVGILGSERMLADRPAKRRLARLGWALLLAFSLAFNLLVTLEHYSDAQNELGAKLLYAGNPMEAVTHFEQALRLRPDYAEAHFNLGTALAKLGRTEDAIQQYEEALRIQPDYAEAHMNLGNALLGQGQPDDALRHCQEAVRIKPNDAGAHMSLGNVLLRRGRGPEAIAQYEEALRIKPDYPQAHDDLGIALAQAGRIPEALQHWEKALSLKPDDVEAHYNLASALERQGRLPEAIQHYRQAVQSNPGFTEAHVNLGIALSQVGSNEEALTQFETALQQRPDSPEVHCNLGFFLLQTGKLPEAVEHFEQALRIKPDYADAHFNLGLALEKLGRTPEAVGHYQQALKLRPDFTPAARALARLGIGQ